MSQFHNFSSLPPEQEATFVVYEEQQAQSLKKGYTIGAIAGAIFFVLALGIYVGVEPDQRDIAKDMNMSNLTKSSKPEKAEKPAAPPAEKPAAPAEAPAAEAPAAPK